MHLLIGCIPGNALESPYTRQFVSEEQQNSTVNGGTAGVGQSKHRVSGSFTVSYTLSYKILEDRSSNNIVNLKSLIGLWRVLNADSQRLGHLSLCIPQLDKETVVKSRSSTSRQEIRNYKPLLNPRALQVDKKNSELVISLQT